MEVDGGPQGPWAYATGPYNKPLLGPKAKWACGGPNWGGGTTARGLLEPLGPWVPPRPPRPRGLIKKGIFKYVNKILMGF